MLELVAAWTQEREPPAQYLYTALGWRYSYLLTQEEEEGGQTWRHAWPCASTRPLLTPFADPHNPNARRRLPDSAVSTSVPVVRLASVAFTVPHPLDGVLQMSSPRGWARLGEQCRPRVRSQLRTLKKKKNWGKSAKTPFTRLISAFFNTS